MAKPRKTAPHELAGEDQLVAKIEEVRAERRRLVKLPNTATAVGGTHKLEAELLKQLREALAQKEKPKEQPAMTVDQALDALLAIIPALPDPAVDLLEQAITARRQGRPLLREVR